MLSSQGGHLAVLHGLNVELSGLHPPESFHSNCWVIGQPALLLLAYHVDVRHPCFPGSLYA
jgi:hypothetical protein